MIHINYEQLTPLLISELMPILEQHRTELQSHEMALNPQWDVYMQMQQLGKSLWVIARIDGEIVGYSLFIINANLHYQDYLYAIEDVFYVVPDRRGSRIAVKLIKASELKLKDMGVDVVTHHAKFTNSFAGFLEKMGYVKTEVMLAKRLQ